MSEATVAANPDEIRLQFEEVLRNNIRRLMDTMPEAASLPFDIVTITSLILLVERENEIETFPESAEDRYSEETLIHELAATGIDDDDHLKASVSGLASMGFVTINQDDELIPRESTPKLVAVLENLFPGMPGLNLVAYFLQTLQEAVTGRKDVEQAIRQFDQTLFSRGVSLSERDKSADLNRHPKGAEKTPKPASQASSTESDRRDAYMLRLREMRVKQSGKSSGITSAASVTPLQNVEVKPLFPPPTVDHPDAGEDVSDAIETPPVVTDPDVDADTEIPVETFETETPDTTPDIESKPQTDDRSSEFSQTDIVKMESDQPEEPSPEAEPHVADADTVIPAVEIDDETADVEAPPGPTEDSAVSSPSDSTEAAPATNEDFVDDKIQAFQEYLAMTCPFCREGKVLAAETEKGKVYYSCENTACNFISWGKPYHFSCPFCQNPFLVEFNTHDGINGLKCPKATCNFRQDHLESPAITPLNPVPPMNPGMAAQGVPEAPKKKRKKRVRKRLVRKKR